MLGQYLGHLGLGEWNYKSGRLSGSGNTHRWIERERLLVDITADQFPDVTESVIVPTDGSWHARFTPMAGNR
jgi:hypothetical protein